MSLAWRKGLRTRSNRLKEDVDEEGRSHFISLQQPTAPQKVQLGMPKMQFIAFRWQ